MKIGDKVSQGARAADARDVRRGRRLERPGWRDHAVRRDEGRRRGRERGRRRGAGRTIRVVRARAQRAPAPPADSATPSPAAPAPPAASNGDGGGPVYASPSVRRLARELGVDLHQVTGSGRKGRITRTTSRRLSTRPVRPAASGRRSGSGGGAGPGLNLPPWPSSTSRSSARSSASSAPGSSGSRRRTWRATG